MCSQDDRERWNTRALRLPQVFRIRLATIDYGIDEIAL